MHTKATLPACCSSALMASTPRGSRLSHNSIKVYCLPRMRQFLEENGPWNQLIALGNIILHDLTADVPVRLGKVTVTPTLVPHKVYYTETCGYTIRGEKQAVLYVPDVDDWTTIDIAALLADVAVAYVDGTYYDAAGRPARAVPHPTIQQTIDLWAPLSADDKAKIKFIHFHHKYAHF